MSGGGGGPHQPATGPSSSAAFLDDAAEAANRQIDADIKTLLDSFDALIGLSRIRDKDKIRVAQERLEAEARADSMVRAAQSLALLSHSLKLSLLLSEEPTGHGIRDGIGSRDHGDVPSAPTDKSRSMSGSETAPSPLDEEALRLIKSTLRSRQACAGLLDDILGPSTDAIDGDGEHDFEVGDERGRAEAPLP